jgi:hypothetical protein
MKGDLSIGNEIEYYLCSRNIVISLGNVEIVLFKDVKEESSSHRSGGSSLLQSTSCRILFEMHNKLPNLT